MPWCGLLERIDRADVHVHLDDVQYSKGTFFARNRILDYRGREVMLTVPVLKSLSSTFNDVCFPHSGWQRKHWLTISQLYPRNEVNADVLHELQVLLSAEYKNLAELNIASTNWMLKTLGISTPTYRASEMGVPGTKDERLVNLCRHFRCDTYYSPGGAREYIHNAVFDNAGIRLQYQSYRAVPYAQARDKEFVPNLSALDVILRHGPRKALEIVRAGAEVYDGTESDTLAARGKEGTEYD
jgi:hypothetical protein